MRFRIQIFSFASQIEIRDRSNPDCLDDVTIQPTLRNIYLCLWHVKRNEASKVLSNSNITPFMKYILQSLQFNETQNEKSKIDIDNFLNKTVVDDDYKLFQFLRCAAIFDHFARCSKLIEKVDNKIVDWDEILGSTYLCKFYNIQHLLKKFVSENNIELTLPMISFGFHSSSFFCSDSRVQRRCDNFVPFDRKKFQFEERRKKQ